MGNSQSQGSDEENGQSHYNYHEKVLHEARLLSRSALPGGYESDDQYFSAEEGDSDRSITPPRNRPESSSGEDFSDDSETEEMERNAVDTDMEMSQTSASALSFSGPSSTKRKNEFLSPGVRKWKGKTSCGQCNVSRFQEHDSIGPELDTSHWDVDTSHSMAVSARRSQSYINIASYPENDLNLSNTSNQAMFKPINSPFTPRKYQAGKHSSFDIPISQSPSKRRKMLRISPNKKRIGIFDEQDSSDEEEVVVKKARISNNGAATWKGEITASPSSTASRSNRSKESGENVDDVVLNSEGAGSSDTNTGENVALRSGTSEKEKYKQRRGDGRDGESDEGEDSCLPSVSEKTLKVDNVSFKNKNTEVAKSSGNTSGSKETGRSGGAFQPLRNKQAFVVVTRLEELSTQGPTLKMGRCAIRNSHGKVVPILQTDSGVSPSSAVVSSSADSILPGTSFCDGPSSHKSHSDSLLVKIGSKLRLRKLSLSKEVDKKLEQNIDKSHESSSHTLESSSSILPSTTSEVSLTETESNEADQGPNRIVQDSGDDAVYHVSPFHNVVLTPPSARVLSDKDQVGCHSLKRAMSDGDILQERGVNVPSCGLREGEDLMETEDHRADAKASSSDHHQRNSRISIKAKRPSAPQRLKTLFNTSSLRSNLKSFFSRSTDDAERECPPGTGSPSGWSLFSSSSTNLCEQSSLPRPSGSGSLFQSTSSPMESSASAVSLASVDFSPIVPRATDATPASLLPSEQIKKPSPLSQDSARKTPRTVLVPTRSSERLRHARDATPSSISPPNTSSISPGTTNIPRITMSPSPRNPGASRFSPTSPSMDVQLLPTTSQFQVLRCHLANAVELSVTMADIAMETSSGIVNCTDGSLTHMTTGSSRRICAKAGALMRAACRSYLENKESLLEPPDVLTTPAGGSFPRSVRSLLHVVLPPSNTIGLASCLLEVNANCLRFANERLGLDSLSLPLIGEGDLPTQLCAKAFMDAVLVFISERRQQQQQSSPRSSPQLEFDLTSIRLVTEDVFNTDQAAEAIQARIDQVQARGLDATVAEIRTSYYSHRNLSPVAATKSSPNTLSDADRAVSGRPRVKRKRL